MTQIALPNLVTPEQVSVQRSMGEAIELCLRIAGYEIDKTPASELGIDKAQFSRWKSNQEGIKWEKLSDLMDRCGNDAPLLWMLHARGYDLTSLRQKETELQRENRQLREQLSAARILLGVK